MKCECENSHHIDKNDDFKPCDNEATKRVHTIFGTYHMCDTCLAELPISYYTLLPTMLIQDETE